VKVREHREDERQIVRAAMLQKETDEEEI